MDAVTGRGGSGEPDQCRPVTVEVDCETVTMRVRAEEPMSDEGRAALAEIIAAARRKFDADAPNRCGDAVRCTFDGCGREHVCTKQPHSDEQWHADGTGVRWRPAQETIIRHGRAGGTS